MEQLKKILNGLTILIVGGAILWIFGGVSSLENDVVMLQTQMEAVATKEDLLHMKIEILNAIKDNSSQ